MTPKRPDITLPPEIDGLLALTLREDARANAIAKVKAMIDKHGRWINAPGEERRQATVLILAYAYPTLERLARPLFYQSTQPRAEDSEDAQQ